MVVRWVRGWHLVVDCQPVGSSIAHPRMKTHLWTQPARFLNFITIIIPFSLTCVNPKNGEGGLGGELEVEIEKSISCLLNIGWETKIPEKTIFNWENTGTPTSTVLFNLLCNNTQKFRIFLLPVRNRDVICNYAYHGGGYVVNEEQKLWIDRPPSLVKAVRCWSIFVWLDLAQSETAWVRANLSQLWSFHTWEDANPCLVHSNLCFAHQSFLARRVTNKSANLSQQQCGNCDDFIHEER